MGVLNMPIDPRMVKWDAEESPNIDPRMVKWDTASPAPTSAKEESFFDKLKKGTITERIKAGTILYPEEETFVRRTLQGAASGPVSGIVQKIAQATGNTEVSDKIAQTAKDGNFVGALLQPETWLTGQAAAKFINKGANLGMQALRTGLTTAPIAAVSATANPSDSVIADTAKQGALGMAAGTVVPLALQGLVAPIAKTAYNIVEPYLPSFGTGSTGAQKAGARLVDKVATGEKQTDEITQLLLKAQPGQTAADAILPAKNAEVTALQKLVSETRPSLARAVEEGKDAAARNEIANIAGTPELMQRVIERRASRTEPMRKAAMVNAGMADETIGRLGPKVQQKYDSMVSALQDTGKLYALEGQTRNILNQKINSSTPGWVKPETISGLEDSVLKARAGTQEANAMKWQRQDEGDFLVRQIESLKDYGLKPLDVDEISASITRRMKQPGEGIGIDAKVLEGVGNEIKRIQALKGRVYPEDLHEIRKKGINDVIESLNTGAPGSTQKRASQVASDVRTKIDEVLDEASGGMWSPYLKSFQRLSRAKDSMETGQELKDALTGRFGNERIAPFGTALRNAENKVQPYSGKTAMDALYPRQRAAVQRVADQFEKERQISELSKAGSPEALRVMRATELPGTAPGMISWKITALNKVLNLLEGIGGVKTNKTLAEMMLKNPKMLGQLMANKAKPTVDPTVRAIIERQAASAASQNGLLNEPTSTRRQSTSGLLN
jgi:hypothetical protein